MAQLDSEQARKKYLELANSAGTDTAISALHREICTLEEQVFDAGTEAQTHGGSDLDLKTRLEYVEELRTLARELFNLRLKGESMHFYPKKGN